MKTTVKNRCVRIDWRDDGRVGYRTTTLDDLRGIAADYPRGGINTRYTVDTPGGQIRHSEGRTRWSDQVAVGCGRELWIGGDLTSLVEIAESMLAGKTFPEIHAEA
jgi:hypothetical protein